jgi:hypothetical protein
LRYRGLSTLEQDRTGLADYANYEAAIKQIKMQGGVLDGSQIERDL